MATFIKLFATRIVARSMSGFFSSDSTSFADFDFECFNLFLSFGARLKNATSLAEINPEKINKKAITTKPRITEFSEVGVMVNSENPYLRGSGSNVL